VTAWLAWEELGEDFFSRMSVAIWHFSSSISALTSEDSAMFLQVLAALWQPRLLECGLIVSRQYLFKSDQGKEHMLEKDGPDYIL